MKTSLSIEDRLFKLAQQEAQKTRSTLSSVLSHWARVGLETINKKQKEQKQQSPKFKPVDLGGPAQIDLRSRRDWMDSLDA